jgi:hypothetical protein
MFGFISLVCARRGRLPLGDDADNGTFDQPLPLLDTVHFSPDQLRARIYGLLSVFLAIDLILIAVYAWRRWRRPSHAGYVPGTVITRDLDLESQSSAFRR